MTEKKVTPFDLVQELSESHNTPRFESAPSAYVPYVINRALSATAETVLLANEMNLYWGLDKDQQHMFYHHTIRKRKRYFKWLKSESPPEHPALQALYKYSLRESRRAIRTMTESQREHYRALSLSLSLIGGSSK
jgi:hypothetical protein